MNRPRMFMPARGLKYRAAAGLSWALLLAGAIGCAHHHHRLVLSPWTAPDSRPGASQPSSRPSVHVSDMGIQIFPEQNYLFESTKATALDVQQAIERITSDLAGAANSGRVTFGGPCIFVFHGRSTELQRPFTLEIGFPVADGTRPFGRFQVRKLPPFNCAAVTFDGPGSLVDKAYDKLDPAMEAAHLSRTDEIREVYLNWEGPDSPNDRIQVGIGVR